MGLSNSKLKNAPIQDDWVTICTHSKQTCDECKLMSMETHFLTITTLPPSTSCEPDFSQWPSIFPINNTINIDFPHLDTNPPGGPATH